MAPFFQMTMELNPEESFPNHSAKAATADCFPSQLSDPSSPCLSSTSPMNRIVPLETFTATGTAFPNDLKQLSTVEICWSGPEIVKPSAALLPIKKKGSSLPIIFRPFDSFTATELTVQNLRKLTMRPQNAKTGDPGNSNTGT
jgi:hypothetical protein